MSVIIISHFAFTPFYDYTSSPSIIFLRFQENVFWLTASGLEDVTEGRPLSIKSLPPWTQRHPPSTLRHSPPRFGDWGPSSLPSCVRCFPDLRCWSFSCKLLLWSNLRREGGGRAGAEPAAATWRVQRQQGLEWPFTAPRRAKSLCSALGSLAGVDFRPPRGRGRSLWLVKRVWVSWSPHFLKNKK